MTDEKSEEKIAMTEEAANKELDGTLGTGDGFDSSKVKFINGSVSDHDVAVEVGGEKKQVNSFCGLTKEELKQYANDPYWVRVRWVLLILFWMTWIGMLVAAIVIIIVAPKCPPQPKLDWWQKEIVYEAYPKSFKDSDGDGVGDLNGIKDSLTHLSALNVKALRLSSIYNSVKETDNHAISDHKAIDPVFGTLEDFGHLLTDMHKKDIKLIMDFVPNHTSRNHTWFQSSCKKVGKYRDYYVWSEGGAAPNNWLSVNGGSAWEKDDACGGFYLHQFDKSQPDLNLRNADVQQELKDILTYWLDYGVDGFHVDNAAHLFESESLADEPSASGSGYDGLDHTMTTFQPETYKIITDWRALLDQVASDSGKKRFMVVEASGTSNQTSQFYEYDGKKGAHFPQNTALLDLQAGCNGKCVSDLVKGSLVDFGYHQSWLTGNCHTSRVASRVGKELVNAVNMMLYLLPGTPTTYYGEEIGMTNNDNIPAADKVDPHGHDAYRTPMQWSNKKNAGFSEADKTWLPVNADYETVNVQAQKAHGMGFTDIEAFTALTKLRQEFSFQWGVFTEVNTKKDSLFAFMRRAQGFQGYLVLINFGPDDALAEVHAASNSKVPKTATIAASTGNFRDRSREFKVGTVAQMDNIFLKPYEGVVFRWEWEDAPYFKE